MFQVANPAALGPTLGQARVLNAKRQALPTRIPRLTLPSSAQCATDNPLAGPSENPLASNLGAMHD
eukprot:2379338-Karenia_brevis.AAC.1